MISISVVMATRNRGRRLTETVESILRNGAVRYELIIVDQSESSSAKDALVDTGLINDANLRYERVQTIGVCRARNHGIGLAAGDVVLFTDDDCIVPADWIEHIRQEYEEHPDMDVFFGGVTSPVSAEGWSYRFRPVTDGPVKTGSRDVPRKFGLASNMAVRRRALERIGPFDEMLGAGAAFAPSDDTDYAYRALKAGCSVYAASNPTVLHLGAPRNAHGQSHQYGIAAMSAKHFRCGDLGMIRHPLGLIVAGFWRGTLNLATGRRPSGYGTAVHVLAGLVRSSRHSVDVQARLYRTEPWRPTFKAS